MTVPAHRFSDLKVLAAAICDFPIAQGSTRFGQAVASHAKVRHYSPNATVISQGDVDDDVHFILSGKLGIRVNERRVAERRPREIVGEVAAASPARPRIARVYALESSTVASIPSGIFRELAADYTWIWRQVAVTLADRLAELGERIGRPNPNCRVFVGSSREALPIARKIRDLLDSETTDVVLWDEGVVGPGHIVVDELVAEISRCDFGVFIAQPDEHVVSRGAQHMAPRDNVIFEVGLSVGQLGRRRTFLMQPVEVSTKVPVDLEGVTSVLYSASNESSENSLEAAAETISAAIAKAGAR